VEQHVFDVIDPAAAPDLINVEVLHTLRRLERRRYLDIDRAADALSDFALLPIARYPTLDFLEHAWELRHDFTPYDAVYIALADALGTPLVTADRHLAEAIPDHTSVDVITLP
jgi:predicted nucleic acid-binding protein